MPRAGTRTAAVARPAAKSASKRPIKTAAGEDDEWQEF